MRISTDRVARKILKLANRMGNSVVLVSSVGAGEVEEQEVRI